MISTVHAIYENGVFRPVERVDLPDRTPVEFESREWLSETTQATDQ